MRSRAPLVLALLLSTTAAWAADAPSARPQEWATAVAGTTVGNLYRIEDGFFRGAQPSAGGVKELSGLGVRAILDLAGGAGDGALVPDGSVQLFHVPMSAWGLHDDQVLEALRVMIDPANRPLMVHCQHGADRTGALVALYRVVVQGWTKDAAIREMNRGGYHHSFLFKNLDRYVQRADVAALRKALSLDGPARDAVSTAHADVPAAAVAGLPSALPVLVLP